MIDLNKIAKQFDDVSKKRDLPQSSFDLMKHCAGEVLEAAQAFERLDRDCDTFEFSLELCDVIVCCLIIASRYYIDIETALDQCLQKNKLKIRR